MSATRAIAPSEDRQLSSQHAVFFDFGGVLSPSLPALFELYESKTGVTVAALQAAMAAVGRDLGAHPLAHIELAQLSEAEWGSRLREHLTTAGHDASRARLEAFGEQWFADVEANPSIAAAVRAVREQGITVGVLSNNVVEWEPFWHKIIEPLGPFDAVVDSCRVGARKPDPEIFRIAEEAIGVHASECILVDDLEENCAAARSCGWTAVHYRPDVSVPWELAALTGTHTAPCDHSYPTPDRK